MQSLEAVWEDREENVYPSLFGEESRGIFALSGEIFAGVFGQSRVDPRWLHHGVLEYAPSKTRPTWLHVTSGTSNPWEQEPADYYPEAYSGVGTELVLETQEQSDWAIDCLRKLLAYNILLAHGRFGDAEPLDYGHRVPLGGPINWDPTSPIRFIVIAEPSNFPSSFQLASGQADILEIVGITEAERDYAKAEGSGALITRLKDRDCFPVTNPTRDSVV
jgi:hypothetical protein